MSDCFISMKLYVSYKRNVEVEDQIYIAMRTDVDTKPDLAECHKEGLNEKVIQSGIR